MHFLLLMLLLSVPSAFISAETALIPDKLILRADDNLGIIYTHALKKNQTIYGLAKFFNTNIDKISEANPGVQLNAIKLNQQVNIPINTDMISSERNLSPSKSYIPVFYTVKSKDNLFRIAKVYFDQSIDNVMKINKLENMELSIGQKLLVGWYEYNPVYKQRLAWNEKGIEVDASVNGPSRTITKTTTTTTNNVPISTIRQETKIPASDGLVFQKVISSRTDNDSDISNNRINPEKVIPQKQNVAEKTAPSKENTTVVEYDEPTNSETALTEETIVEEEEAIKELSSDPFENRNGIFTGEYENKPVIKDDKLRAQWNPKSKDKVNLFALHATAKTNSYIEIYNPMLDRKVIAKVVGNIPPKAFKKNVELIVSPKVAETLGAKDKKFFVKVRFIE